MNQRALRLLLKAAIAATGMLARVVPLLAEPPAFGNSTTVSRIDVNMPPQPDLDFILQGAATEVAVLYVRRAEADRHAWTAYDLDPEGGLTNPRPVSAGCPASWRGVPTSV